MTAWINPWFSREDSDHKYTLQVKLNTTYEALALPAELGVRLEDASAESVPVTWKSDRPYRSNEKGEFLFTAQLPKGYQTADGVELPQIDVLLVSKGRSGSTGHVITSPIDMRINNGFPVREDRACDQPGCTCWSWDYTNKIFTLNGATINCTRGTFALKVPGDATIILTDGTVNTLTSSGQMYGFYAYEGSPTFRGNGTLNITSGTRSAMFAESSCGMTINSGTFNLTSAAELIEVGQTLTINGGHITGEVVGNNRFICRVKTDTLNFNGGYLSISGNTNTSPISCNPICAEGFGPTAGEYNNRKGEIVVYEELRFATIGNITIEGVPGEPITNQTVTLTLSGDSFSADLAGADVSGWFSELPAGLTVTADAAANGTTATLTFGGTPTAASNGKFSLKIPASQLTGGTVVAVKDNPKAKFSLRTLTGVEVGTQPTKTDYVYGECFDPAGLKLNQSFSESDTEEIAYNEETAGSFSFAPGLETKLTTADTAVIVTYRGKTTTVPIAVVNKAVAITGLTANGEADVASTTELTLTFDKAVEGLTVDDITLTGATKGALTTDDNLTYKLAVSVITVADGENVTVALAKNGVTFTPASKTVAIHKVGPAYEYNSTTKTLTINRNAGATDWRKDSSIKSYLIKTISIKDGVTELKSTEIDGITVGAFDDCTEATAVNIPQSVTVIGDLAFFNCVSLDTIVLPSGVTSIGSNAFRGTGITSITIPQGVTEIPLSAFESAEYLESVTFQGNVTSIGVMAFMDTAISQITLPESLTTIDDVAFMNTPLTTITIPASVTKIADGAFSGCGSLATVVMKGATPATLGGDGVFTLPLDFKILVSTDAAADAYKAAWPIYKGYIVAPPGYEYDAASKTLTITTNKGTTNWRNNTSIDKSKVTTVVLEEGVTEIGTEAFYQCSALSSVTIPEGVTKIANKAFSECRSLQQIALPSTLTTLGIAVLYNSGLTSITVPAGVTVIPDSAFYRCESLESVILQGNVTSIEKLAFASTKTSQITLPDSLTSIGETAFAYTKLTAITIPAGVTQIGVRVFMQSTSLATITMKGETPAALGELAFDSLPADFVINVPTPGAVSAYRTAANWSTYATHVDFAAAFSGLTANGDNTTNTTKLTLTFDKNMNGLAVDDITLTGATKGGLTANEAKTVYTLAISNITAADQANVTVALAKDGCTITPASKDVAVRNIPRYAVTVNSGTGGDDYAKDATVTITANAPAAGKRFKEWTIQSGSIALANAKSATTTFKMPARSVEVTATYEAIPATKYAVTVNGGIGSGNYTEGTTVTINANAPLAGKKFKEWTVQSGDITLVDAKSAETSFAMPGEDVEVTATYKDTESIFSPDGGTYEITVNQDVGESLSLTRVSPDASIGDRTWKVATGKLPTGMTLAGYSGSVQLRGTPTVVGNYTFTLSAESFWGDLYTTKSFTVTVKEAGATPTPTAKPSTPPAVTPTPTIKPTASPTAAPTISPTVAPTASPSATVAPTEKPKDPVTGDTSNVLPWVILMVTAFVALALLGVWAWKKRGGHNGKHGA